MDSSTYIIFFILPFSFAEHGTTSPPPTTSLGTPTTIAPIETCECLNITGLQKDLDKIITVLGQTVKLDLYRSEMNGILSELAEIKDAVQDKTCQCTEGSILIQLEEKANEMIDEALTLTNTSALCACENSKKMSNNTQIILARIDKLRTLTNLIHTSVIDCEEELRRFESKLDIIIDNTSGNSSLEISPIKHTINEILDKVCEIQKDGCKCEDQFKVIYDLVFERTQTILNILDKINKVNDSKIEAVLKFLEKIDGKIDKIMEKSNTVITKECNCLTFNEYIINLPKCCDDPKEKELEHEMKKKKEVKPWEISEMCKEELLCDYESCIKDAIHDLDDWFKPGTWNRMPQGIKKVMIILYCKVGLKSLKSFKAVKLLLEAGKWKEAAGSLGRTRWARLDPVSAKDVIKRLLEVNEKMADQ